MKEIQTDPLPASRPYATDEIGRVHEPGRDFIERATGMLAIPVSRTPRDFLVFFRSEVSRTVTWAGNPEKPATPGPNGVRLSPRKSFEAWREVVHGRSLPWAEVELRAAEALRVTLLEVILRLTDTAEKERKGAQERQELLIAELNHRVRNILNLIRGVVTQSRSDELSGQEFAALVGSRIQALARAHDQITTSNWGPGSLRNLILLEAGAYLGGKADRLIIEGTDVLLDPQAFSTMALVIHEMMTNSAKYGALCDRHGRVDVRLERDALDHLVVHWRESGGPAVKAPTRRGFGTTIIERSIPYELKGEAKVSYELTGVEACFSLPPSFVKAAPITPVVRAVRGKATMPLRIAGTVLLVGDNMIIALEAEELLTALGAEIVDMAASTRDALRLMEASPPNWALLDVNLGSETSIPVARRLAELGIPYAFATGYGESFKIPPDLEAVPVVKKPYDADALRQAFA